LDKSEFQQEVNKLEAAHSYLNLSLLWKDLEQTDWAKAQSPRPLLAAVASVRAKELGITTKTAPGRKGRIQGLKPTGGKRKGRAEKFKEYSKTFDEIEKELISRGKEAVRNRKPDVCKRWLPLVQKARNGSVKACVALKCIDCSGYQATEIKYCTLFDCALYPLRPYKQGKPMVDDEGVVIPEESTCASIDIAKGD
jgi:hypothetical protein